MQQESECATGTEETSVRVTEIQREHSQSIREKVSVPLGHGFFNKLGGSSVPMDKSKLQSYIKNCGTAHPTISNRNSPIPSF